jgi:hypothetical protein
VVHASPYRLDVHGKTRSDAGEMFAPIRSDNLYELVVNSRKTFDVGREYW